MTKLKIFLGVVIIHVSGVLHAQQAEFGWMVGTWKLNDKPVFETWKAASGGELKGGSYKINGNDTVWFERVRLVHKNDKFYYVPDVAGDQPEVYFEIVEQSQSHFVARNDQHDFPKVIRYKWLKVEGKEFIDAAIEGNGKVIPYHFQRIK